MCRPSNFFVACFCCFFCFCSCAFADANNDLMRSHSLPQAQKALDNGATNINQVFSYKLTHDWKDYDNAKILMFLNLKHYYFQKLIL